MKRRGRASSLVTDNEASGRAMMRKGRGSEEERSTGKRKAVKRSKRR